MRQTFTVDELDKHYRLNGPADGHHQALAFKKVLFQDDGVLVVLEPDNSLYRDVWRLDRDDVEAILRRRIMKTWGWSPKQINFSWTDELDGVRKPMVDVSLVRRASRIAAAMVLSRRA